MRIKKNGIIAPSNRVENMWVWKDRLYSHEFPAYYCIEKDFMYQCGLSGLQTACDIAAQLAREQQAAW